MLVTMSDKELNRVNKSLTFRYDKMIYLVDPTEENSRNDMFLCFHIQFQCTIVFFGNSCSFAN